MDQGNAKHAAAVLGQRLRCWTVWYGEYTGRFWAVPRVRELAATSHIESPTPGGLEEQAREIEQRFRIAQSHHIGR